MFFLNDTKVYILSYNVNDHVYSVAATDHILADESITGFKHSRHKCICYGRVILEMFLKTTPTCTQAYFQVFIWGKFGLI